MKRKRSRNNSVVLNTPQSATICNLPSDVFNVIFRYVGCNFATIASLRQVCQRFNLECGRMLNQGAVRLMNDVVDFMNKSADGSVQNNSSYRVSIIYLNLRELFDEYSRFIDEERCFFTPGKVIDEARRLLQTNKEAKNTKVLDENDWKISLSKRDPFNQMCSRAKSHFTTEVIPRLQAKALDKILERKSQAASTKRQKVQRSFSSLNETLIAPYIFYHKPSAEPGTLDFLEKRMHVIIKDQEDTIYFQKCKIVDLKEANVVLHKSINSLKILKQEEEANVVLSSLKVETNNLKTILNLPSDLLCKIFSYVDYESKSKFRSVCKRFNLECQWMLNEGYEKVRKKHERSMEIVKSKLRLQPTEKVLVRKYTHLKDIKCCLEVLCHTYGCTLWENKCCFIAGKVLDKTEAILRLLNDEGPFMDTNLIFKLKEITKMASRHFELHVSPHISKAQVKGFSFLWHASCRSCWNREWRMSTYELGINPGCKLKFKDAKNPQVIRMLAVIEVWDREIVVQDKIISNLFSINSELRREVFSLQNNRFASCI